MKKIAIVIPAYGESENIVGLCKEILSCYSNAEILIVDDSPDNLTVDAVKLFSHPQVSIRHRDKKGAGEVRFFLALVNALMAHMIIFWK
jgi:glycosyltransferase involved in cell wall biosynthesis